MIAEIWLVIQGLFLLFIFFLILRLLYFSLIKLYSKTKSYLGTIIEGSDIYWKRRWKQSHRSEKIVYKNLDNYHPRRGWALIPNLRDKLHYGAIINSNSKGVRGLEEKSSKKKVLFFGDSFGFGEGVDDDETISAYFEKDFKNIQSVNLGIHGYGIDQQYLYLKETISKYKPVLTCFIICDNDFRRTFMDFRDYAKPIFVLKNNQIILENIPVSIPEELMKMRKIPIYELFFELAKNFFIYYGFIKKNERIKICNYLLDEINKTVKENNSELIFIYINDRKSRFLYKNYMPAYFNDYFKKRNITCLNIQQIYGRKKFLNMFDSLSGHLSSNSNKLVADKLAEIIKTKEIIK